ncbi:hypothetical protein CF069_18155 [Clostridium botulinum]
MEKVILTIENGQPVIAEIKPIVVNNKRILTTKQLAEVYQCNETQIQQNFNNHSDKFILNKHYFLLKGDDLRNFKRNIDNIEVAPNVNKLYLWTERGANRHCKILDTDKAWEQFDNLEETYFRVKENKLPPMTIEDIIITQLEEQKKIKKQLTGITNKFEELPLFTVDSKELSKTVNRIAVKFLGGKHSPAYKELSRKVFSDIYRQLWREFDVTSCAAIKRKYLEEAKKIISEYKLPRALANEIEILNNQVSF